jgi:hypothetical protein
MSQGHAIAPCSTFSDGFLCDSYRTIIPWARILALSVPNWMHHVVVLVSRLVTSLFLVFSEDCCLLSVVYNYPSLNASQYYVPPRKEHSGDLDCDCNTVMYKYEVRIPQRGPCADLPFGFKSLHGVCLVSAGQGIPVRSWAAISLRCLLMTSSRWTMWITACSGVYVTQ